MYFPFNKRYNIMSKLKFRKFSEKNVIRVYTPIKKANNMNKTEHGFRALISRVNATISRYE